MIPLLAAPPPAMATSLLLAIGLFLGPTGEPAHLVPPAAAIGGDALEVLARWLALYHQGELDLTGSKLRMRGRNATMRANVLSLE